VPRTEPGALLESDAEACAQALAMIRDQRVRARDGTWVPVRAQTLCLHGDGPHALDFARSIQAALSSERIAVTRASCLNAGHPKAARACC